MERPRRRQNSAWVRPLRRKSLRRALQRVSRISRRGMAWSPGRGLRPRPGYDRPRSPRFPDALHRTDSDVAPFVLGRPLVVGDDFVLETPVVGATVVRTGTPRRVQRQPTATAKGALEFAG